MKQRIEVFSDSPLDSTFVTINVEKGTKILSNAPYAEELYNRYMQKGETLEYEELSDGKLVKATVIGKNEHTVDLEINRKHTSFLNLNKEDPRYVDYIQIGQELYVKLNRKPGSEESYSASFSDAIKENKFQEIKKSIGEPVAFKAKVLELVRGGYFLEIDGVRVFMPGSLAGMNKLWDFDALIGTEIIVMPITFSVEKGTIVVSRRSYLKTMVPIKLEEVRNNLKEKRSGYVTGSSKYGIFVEFEECLTGLIPVNELDAYWLEKFQNKDVKPGSEIECFVKDIISEYKIILTQNATNPWDGIEEKFKPQSVVNGKITSILKYGAFVEIDPGVSGLLHNSEYDNDNLKVGDTISVKITKIDSENKRLTLMKN